LTRSDLTTLKSLQHPPGDERAQPDTVCRIPQLHQVSPNVLIVADHTFNPYRPEVERARIRLRGRQIAGEKGCSGGLARLDAMCELEKLRAIGGPMPWETKVVSITKRPRRVCDVAG
jgi:hypothetical protein